MNRKIVRGAFFAIAICVSLVACSPPPEPAFDTDAWRAEVQKQTERMYWIHLRLDTASEEISKAEIAASEGNASAAQFHAAEAYRSLEQADQALLELGSTMQQRAGLDQQQ